MKFYILLIGFTVFLANIEVHGRMAAKCVGQPVRQACKLRRDLGHNNYNWCKENAMPEMWYYNMIHNSCNKMIYLGCGGNFNRFCSEAECTKACIKTKRHHH